MAVYIGSKEKPARLAKPADSFDVMIVGGGPAGLSAGLYAARAGLEVVLLERMFMGGQAATANHVENYPGFDNGIGGPELTMAMERQAAKAGLVVRSAGVVGLELRGEEKEAELEGGMAVKARAAILAMGARPRKTGVSGEEELRGRGVSWCATCDGFMMKGKNCAVVGGGNTAAEDALYLAGICEHVTVVHRRGEFRADEALARRLREHPKVTIIWDHVVKAFEGEERLRAIEIESVKSQERTRLPVEGVFVAIGEDPDTALVKGQVELNRDGYVVAGEDTRTNLTRVYAAGDLRVKPLRQIVTAVSDGAVAATAAMQDLRYAPTRAKSLEAQPVT
ncbi:MAG: FAD-dependent oxidoreductase [Oscillospiraceae bacterium]|jgi:thioredoxin reductase (NADPH)|nr:FAD-dependent oxidoreductase [Oscillospiraceae bacterium]